MPSNFKYKSLPQETRISTDSNESLREDDAQAISRYKTVQVLHWTLHAISSIAIIFLVFFSLSKSELPNSDCWEKFNYYSPANEAISPYPYVETRFNGSLWYKSPFKGPPTPEVEEAWQSIMRYGTISISADDIAQVGHNVTTASQYPPEVGGGYIAGTMGTHSIHCLHFIWMDHHSKYYEVAQRKMREIPEMYERHYEHCVDIIRQTLLCNYDSGMMTFDWVLQHHNPTPNTNAMHKCVDWNRLQDWLKERVVAIPDGFEWKHPEGQASLDWNP